MNAKEMYSALLDLKVAPATITGLIQDYRKMRTDGDPASKGAFVLKLYKAVEPVLQNIPGWGKLASSAVLAVNDIEDFSKRYKKGEVGASDYLQVVGSSSNVISDALFMCKALQAQAAALVFKTISVVASYGVVMTQGGQGGGDDTDPRVWSEREQAIREHTSLKTDKGDVMEEYYKQAKILLAKEGGWSLGTDIEIAKTMEKQGYEEKKIIDAMQIISPCAARGSDEDALSYANYIIARSKESLAEKFIGEIDHLAKIDEIRKTSLSVEDLPRNPHSKVLFDAYAKDLLGKDGQAWTPEMNKTIAENMLKDGVTPQRVEQALKQSPEPVENAYYFVKDIKNSPEIQATVQQSRGGRAM